VLTTLAGLCIIGGIAYYVCMKRKRRDATAVEPSREQVENP
jgi:hypothetical protein